MAMNGACEDYTGAVSVVCRSRTRPTTCVPLIEEIHAALEGVADFEVIFVDDGSTDATAARL